MSKPEHIDTSQVIGDDIVHMLGRSWFFDPQTVTVVEEGTKVTLIGVVRSERERRMAAAAAWSHEGVTDVENALVVG